jgi:hypothetical protein
MNNHLFQLTFPEGWKETTVYTFEGPHDGGVQHNLVLIIDPFIKKDAVVKDYANTQLAGPKQVLPGFEMLGEADKKLADDTPAFEVVYKYVPAENIVFYQKQVYFIKENKAFVFTATFSKKTMQTIACDVDKIIASFLIFKPDQQQKPVETGQT